MLSEGEDKLRRLIQQKKFVEAESYALNNELNVEVHSTYVCIYVVDTMLMYIPYSLIF